MRTIWRPRALATMVAAAVAVLGGCASNPTRPAPAPAFTGVPVPAVPPSLVVAKDVVDRHEHAWKLLQSGDTRGAAQAFQAILQGQPDFYPAETGLGFAHLAAQQSQAAATRFRSVVGRDPRYEPAWQGLVEAELSLGRDAEAIDALERLVALAPEREGPRTRLEVMRLKELQGFIDSARVAKDAGRWDEARALLERALARAPASAAILAELTSVEMGRGSYETAELYARRAIQVDPADAAGHAALGAVLEARGRHREALAAYTAAAAIDPRWAEAVARVRDRTEFGNAPKEFRAIESAQAVTRGEAAAYIGMRLEALLSTAPRRVVTVATDVRQHWAEPWIIAVTSAGIMEILPNHTFQPTQAVRRDELAASLAVLVELATAGRPKELAGFRAVRPSFSDLPEAHLFYAPAALAVASGTMTATDDGRFQPARLVTGAEFVRAIKRIQQIAGR